MLKNFFTESHTVFECLGLNMKLWVNEYVPQTPAVQCLLEQESQEETAILRAEQTTVPEVKSKTGIQRHQHYQADS